MLIRKYSGSTETNRLVETRRVRKTFIALNYIILEVEIRLTIVRSLFINHNANFWCEVILARMDMITSWMLTFLEYIFWLCKGCHGRKSCFMYYSNLLCRYISLIVLIKLSNNFSRRKIKARPFGFHVRVLQISFLNFSAISRATSCMFMSIWVWLPTW